MTPNDPAENFAGSYPAGSPLKKEKHAIMKKKRAAQLLLAACGLAFLVLGVAQGGYQTTMAKAVRICMECIGIG